MQVTPPLDFGHLKASHGSQVSDSELILKPFYLAIKVYSWALKKNVVVKIRKVFIEVSLLVITYPSISVIQ